VKALLLATILVGITRCGYTYQYVESRTEPFNTYQIEKDVSSRGTIRKVVELPDSVRYELLDERLLVEELTFWGIPTLQIYRRNIVPERSISVSRTREWSADPSSTGLLVGLPFQGEETYLRQCTKSLRYGIVFYSESRNSSLFYRDFRDECDNSARRNGT